MELKFPPPDTARFNIYQAVYKFSPATLSQVAERLPKISREAIRATLRCGVATGILERAALGWTPTKAAKKYFDDLSGTPESDFVPQIVPPRETNVWTPEMKGYEANLRRLWRAV